MEKLFHCKGETSKEKVDPQDIKNILSSNLSNPLMKCSNLTLESLPREKHIIVFTKFIRCRDINDLKECSFINASVSDINLVLSFDVINNQQFFLDKDQFNLSGRVYTKRQINFGLNQNIFGLSSNTFEFCNINSKSFYYQQIESKIFSSLAGDTEFEIYMGYLLNPFPFLSESKNYDILFQFK